MNTSTPIIEDTLPNEAPTTTAGALLRGYRQAHGVELDAMAKALRVSVTKLEALENDQLDALPDAMFARALSLAVCRHLRTDANPVLALLPEQDANRLAFKSERGLNFPLERPSLLPQSSFVVIERFFTPMRWAALTVFLLALALAIWPDLQPWLVFKDDAQPASAVIAPVETTVVMPMNPAAPSVDEAGEKKSQPTNMVVTSVYSPAVTALQEAKPPVEGASAHAK